MWYLTNDSTPRVLPRFQVDPSLIEVNQAVKSILSDSSTSLNFTFHDNFEGSLPAPEVSFISKEP